MMIAPQTIKLNKKIDRLKYLEKSMPKVSGIGTSIKLENTIEYPFYKMILGGNSFQNNYTGKNVFNKSRTPSNVGNATKTAIETGIRATTANSTSTWCNVRFTIGTLAELYGKTIRMATTIVRGSGNTNDGQITISTATSTYGSITSKVSKKTTGYTTVSYTVTENDPDKILFVSFYANTGTAGANLSIDYQDLIITIDNEDLTYEPYTGNQPSPNPDYPQDVKVVTGNNNVIINNGNLGNMTALYNDMYAFNPSYVRQEVVDGKNCIVFTNDKFSRTNGFLGLPNRYKNNTAYKLNADLRINDTSHTSGYELTIRFAYSDGTSDRVLASADGSNWMSKELISDPSKTVVGICFSYGTQAYWCLANLSIKEYVEGETYTYKESQEQNYPISLGNIELCKKGDYQDSIIKKSDGWYKRAEIGKTTDASGSTSKTILDMIADSGFYSYYGGTLSGQTITYASAIQDTNIIYYPLETPTETKITDITLIKQLNKVYEDAIAYDEQTNIVSSCSEGNIPFIIEAEAISNDYESRITALEEAILSQGANV